MNADRPLLPPTPNPIPSRDAWVREVFSVAEALRRMGRHRRLRDVTIVLPIDYTAVEAIELACQVQIQGELSPAATELDRFFDKLMEDPLAAERFVDSVRSVAQRVGETKPRK